MKNDGFWDEMIVALEEEKKLLKKIEKIDRTKDINRIAFWVYLLMGIYYMLFLINNVFGLVTRQQQNIVNLIWIPVGSIGLYLTVKNTKKAKNLLNDE